MKENMQVVEIMDKIQFKLEETNGRKTNNDWFKPISDIANIRHYQYITDDNHTSIKENINVVVELDTFERFLDNHRILQDRQKILEDECETKYASGK